MSKFLEKIRKVTRLQSQPLGFGAGRAADEPTMLLAACTGDPAAVADLARRGADAVIVDLSKSSGPPPKPGAADGLVVGALIGARTEGDSTACKDAGYDFVVFDPETAAATALLEESVGYVLVLPPALTDSEARTLDGLQLDAIDVGTIGGAMTVRQQLDLRRIYALTRRPLMAGVSPDVSVTELQTLRDTNVAVVVADAADGVERLRKTIDALPQRTRRKDSEDRPTPLVPRALMAEEETEEHDHDHD